MLPNRSLPKVAPILLFDGVCNLCSSAVQFILRHESAPTLRFAALQSEAGQALLAAHGLPPGYQASLVLIEGPAAYTDSDAALRTAAYLRLPWRWLAGLRALYKPARDAAYRFVARRRYRWFGRKPSCWLPTPELSARFLR